MLYTMMDGFQSTASNFGATYTEAGLGTDLTAGGTNHTKNATPTTILSAVADDVYGVAIGFTSGSVSAAARRFLTDIYTDPAGGTSWGASPVIANLAANSPSLLVGGVWYYFPLFLKAGTSIGAACQAETASATMTILIRVFMKPARPEFIKTGTKVVTYGASVGTTVGTTFTPGTSALGSYSASLATTANDIFWWQLGVLVTDTSHTANTGFYDVAIGDASNKVLVMQDVIRIVIGSAEANGMPQPFGGTRIPYKRAASGANVYVRGATLGAPDTGHSGIVYGIVC